MGPMIRAASLRGFRTLVEQLGGDPASLLTRFGIPAAALDSDDGLISITAHDQMLDVAARELDCPDLGLRLAVSQDLSILGPLALAIEASSTVAEAIECASQFMFVHSPALSLGVEPDPRGQRGVVAVVYRKDLRVSPYSAQATELGLGLLHHAATVLVGGRTGLRSVQLPHQPISPVRRYTEHFGVDVKFGREPAALRVDRRMLDERFQGANETIHKIAVEHLARHYPGPDATVAARVRLALVDSLGTRPPSIGQVARLVAVHPRTLQRRLAAEGTTFETLLDEVRRVEAGRYITDTELPFGQVTALVGFSEQSVLTRAVRRWYGATPRELRRRGRAVAHG